MPQALAAYFSKCSLKVSRQFKNPPNYLITRAGRTALKPGTLKGLEGIWRFLANIINFVFLSLIRVLLVQNQAITPLASSVNWERTIVGSFPDLTNTTLFIYPNLDFGLKKGERNRINNIKEKRESQGKLLLTAWGLVRVLLKLVAKQLCLVSQDLYYLTYRGGYFCTLSLQTNLSYYTVLKPLFTLNNVSPKYPLAYLACCKLLIRYIRRFITNLTKVLLISWGGITPEVIFAYLSLLVLNLQP